MKMTESRKSQFEFLNGMNFKLFSFLSLAPSVALISHDCFMIHWSVSFLYPFPGFQPLNDPTDVSLERK